MTLMAVSQNAVVSGIVKDREGKPIEAATVGVAGTAYGATTDENGSFRFEIPAGREFKVDIRHITFDPQVFTVNAKPGENVALNPVLRFKAIEGNTFTIEEERAREKPMRRIEVKDARFNPSVTGGVEALLPSRALGVSNNNELP